MAIKLLNFTSPDLCIADLKAATKEECIEAAVDRLAELGKIHEKQALYEELLARERVESTGIGRGIGIPHIRSTSVVGTLVMIAHLSEPIPFNAIDGEPVDVIFLLAGAKELPGQQLRVLARISKLVRIDSFLKDLRGAETPADIISALRRAEASHF